MDRKTLREIYAQYHSLKAEKEDFDQLAFEKKDKFTEIMALTFPWSYWYAYPYIETLALFVCLAGLEDKVKEAAQSDNPQLYLFDYDFEIDQDDNFTDE